MPPKPVAAPQRLRPVVVTDPQATWLPPLSAYDWSSLGVHLEIHASDMPSTPRYLARGYGVTRKDAPDVLPWILRHRRTHLRPLLFLLTSQELRPWFPLWREAGVAWIATEKRMVAQLAQTFCQVIARLKPVDDDDRPWHLMAIGELPWHNLNESPTKHQ